MFKEPAVRLTIFGKLFLSLMLLSVIVMSVMALQINSSFQSGLQTYLNQSEQKRVELLAKQVNQFYSPTSGWETISYRPHLWAELLMQMGEMPPPIKRPMRKERFEPQENFVPLSSRINLLDKSGRSILGRPENLSIDKEDRQLVKIEIKANNKIVGWISIVQKETISGSLAESFFQSQKRNFYLIAFFAALSSFGVAALLVRHFLKPLKDLHIGAKSLTSGEFDYQIKVHGHDELAELSKVFNQLAKTLEQQKQSREQWLSDISHELRTPIAVLRCEIEAIEDGIRKPEPKYIKSLHDQVLNLGKLVNDLYELSLSDAGVLIDTSQQVNLQQIVEQVTNQNELRLSEKKIKLTRIFDYSTSAIMYADSKSLTQLITNLFENSYRYTNDDGELKVALQQTDNAILFSIEDSAPSVPLEALPKLFDRLYRVDKSRSRASGGSGLGLSICQNIVNAHNGKIRATHSDLGGLKIEVKFPRKDI